MDLAWTQEQESVREAFADFFAKEAPLTRLRAAEPLGFDSDLWHSAVQTGAITMGVPESLGGGDASSLDLVLVAREFGRHLAPIPYVEATAAVDVLAAAEAGHRFIAGIAEGQILPTVALRPAIGGVARLAPAGAVADLIVALDGSELVVVTRSGSKPYAASPRNLADSPIADWDLRADSQERVVLAAGAEAQRLHGRVVSLWRLLTGAALTGLAAQALDIGVNYVKNRQAFGVTIGSFQTIQHRLADVTTAGDGTELLVYKAGWARDEDPVHADALATMAFLAAADIAFRTCREALQFHGGYGYTLEYDIQLYWRRAKAWPLAIGSSPREYQILAAQLWDKTASDDGTEA